MNSLLHTSPQHSHSPLQASTIQLLTSIRLPKGSIRLPNGSIRLPKGSIHPSTTLFHPSMHPSLCSSSPV